MNEWDQRVELVSAYRALRDEGLVVGSAGNLSVRLGETMLITPSGCTPAQASSKAQARMTTCRLSLGPIRPPIHSSR